MVSPSKSAVQSPTPATKKNHVFHFTGPPVVKVEEVPSYKKMLDAGKERSRMLALSASRPVPDIMKTTGLAGDFAQSMPKPAPPVPSDEPEDEEERQLKRDVVRPTGLRNKFAQRVNFIQFDGYFQS